MKPNREHGIENEPHMQNRAFEPQPDEVPLGTNLRTRDLDGAQSDDIDHSVWDEPGAVMSIAGAPPQDALSYRNWINHKIENWSETNSWLLTLAIAFVAAPICGILGVSFSSISWFGGYGHVAYMILFGPVIEEIFKIAFLLWIVEKRPFAFKGWFQIFLCSIVSATLFASAFAYFIVIGWSELPNHPAMLIAFYLMHVVTATLASVGLEKVWRRAIYKKERPQLKDGAVWFMSAYLTHLAWSIAIAIWQIATQTQELFGF